MKREENNEVRELFVCNCGDVEHQIIMLHYNDEKYPCVYCTIHLIPESNIFKRIRNAVRYIFGHRCAYGHFEEFIFNPEDADRLQGVVDYLREIRNLRDRKKNEGSSLRFDANRTSYDEILDRHIGAKGTSARDAFEADMQALKRRFENNEDGYPVEIPNKDVLAGELQERLVQTCLDFIKEKGDKYIWRVEFAADSLQESAKEGRWMPCTDSSISLEGIVFDEEIKAAVRKEIGRYE